MKALPYFSCKRRSTFLSSAADCDDIVPTLVKILRDILRIMTADVNSDLRHYLDSKRMNLGSRLYSGRADFCIRMKLLNNTVCHLASASVACT